jgi:hypothetical protein
MQAKQDLDGWLPGGNGNMNTQIDLNAEKVRMEYFGPRVGAVTYHGKRKKYRFGNNPIDRYDDVNPEDVEKLSGQADFRVVGKDSQSYQAPGLVDFVPEPAGEVTTPDVAPPAEELEEIEVPVPDSVGAFTASGGEREGAVISSDGEPPAPESLPLPGTVKEIKAAVIGADLDTLLSWLREEQGDKKRKTAFEAIENALEENFS